MILQDLKSAIDTDRLPLHVALIMDGNGRWAKQHGKPRVFGHRNGVRSLRETSEAAAELGIKYLTFYAFSTENWNRPVLEVNALMSLLVDTIKKEINTLNKNDIRLQAIGDVDNLPEKSRNALKWAIENTSTNKRMTMVLALNYSARWEILEATKKIAREVKEGLIDEKDIDEKLFSDHLSTGKIPDPELLIRTSGECRLSNFMLWQLSYAELVFTPVLWPDFNKDEFYKAILNYQNRERRFGMISEQIAK